MGNTGVGKTSQMLSLITFQLFQPTNCLLSPSSPKILRQMKNENWDNFNGVFTLHQKNLNLCLFYLFFFIFCQSEFFFLQCHTYQIVMNIPGINSSSQTGSYGIMIPISTLIGF